ncbi:MAG: AI-2E family transporter [Brooklawnia sp.]|uniref:AI-2E family transporter n=1 Tax=Brooklawnia sp. TaxID=2699740 RepID=UPI003C78718F
MRDRDTTRLIPGLGPAGTAGVRLLVFAAVVWLVLVVSARIANVLIPVLLAVLVTALLSPLVKWLSERIPINAHVHAGVVLLGFLAVAAGIIYLTARVMINGITDLEGGVLAGLERLEEWLREGPLQLSSNWLSNTVDSLISWVESNSDVLASGAVQLGGSVVSVGAGAVIMLLSTLFFLGGGAGIAGWLIDRAPRQRRDEVRAAADRVWTSLKAFSRSQLVVAAVDAVGIGLGAYFLGLPFALPIGVLVFFAAFIPIVGALLSGAVAVLIGLAFGGLGKAVIMLVIVLVVQQLESDVVGPLLLGGAVQVHPWAVLVGVACATYVFGLAGALLAVPVMSTIKAIFFPSDPDEDDDGPDEEQPGSRSGGSVAATEAQAT